ncbi:MAG: hypothetical protein J6Q63_06520 [Bacteroidales bacterium]|nr:hypothetical protein [Bacteroidales bacterium]
MKKSLIYGALVAVLALVGACEKPVQPQQPVDPDPQPKPEQGFVEAVPDTVTFTNADFIYYGDITGESSSDDWVVKLYTDMEIDDFGNPVGPGTVTQLQLNAKFDENQGADPSKLKGVYREMMNSGNFAPGTFVSGYMVRLDLPGQTIEMGDGTFYADLLEGSTEMDYDLIDEGAVSIQPNDDGTYIIEGVLVGKKYTKRYFKWTGNIEPRNYVPEETPNSTLKQDMTGLTFDQGQLQDKGDYFYRMDESYRCLLIYLGDESVDMSASRPAGDGAVLRLEVLVPWDVDITKEGIPSGTYKMTDRNLDTSIDKDNIVPGVAIPGLPNVFAAWKVAGAWYYELEGGEWSQTYARIDEGEIVINNHGDGSYTISYDLLDCQTVPKKIQGTTTLAELPIPGKPGQGNQDVVLDANTYALDKEKASFGSVELTNLGEYICIAATPAEGVQSFDAVFEQDEYFYVAISPLLNGKEFDLMTENDLYTVMSTLDGAFLETVAPDMKDEIKEGKCLFNYEDGKATVEVRLTLADGTKLAAKMEAEEPGIVVNENIFAIGGDEKPVRTAFYMKEDGLTTLYLTPAGIDYFEDISITTYYAYIVLDDTQCNGRALDVSDVVAVGYGDNFNEIYVDSREVSAKGALKVFADPSDASHYQVSADITFGGTTLKIRYDGNAIDAGTKEVVKNEVIYNGETYGITNVILNMQPDPVSLTCAVMIFTARGDMVSITLPVNFLDGNAHGFSQSPDLYMDYDGQRYSKATGYSGTITVAEDGDTIRIDATNYDNLKITYEGPYEAES